MGACLRLQGRVDEGERLTLEAQGMIARESPAIETGGTEPDTADQFTRIDIDKVVDEAVCPDFSWNTLQLAEGVDFVLLL